MIEDVWNDKLQESTDQVKVIWDEGVSIGLGLGGFSLATVGIFRGITPLSGDL